MGGGGVLGQKKERKVVRGQLPASYFLAGWGQDLILGKLAPMVQQNFVYLFVLPSCHHAFGKISSSIAFDNQPYILGCSRSWDLGLFPAKPCYKTKSETTSSVRVTCLHWCGDERCICYITEFRVEKERGFPGLSVELYFRGSRIG